MKGNFSTELIKANKALRDDVMSRLDVFEESGDKKLAN